jgi:serine/threonine-protein kinase
MERLEGEDLAARLHRTGLLSVAETAEIMAAVCDAVSAAHRNGVTHRDLKPSNIFLTVRDGRMHPVVVDFGIAQDDEAPGAAEAAAAPPAGKLVFGTPYYLAPEQVADHRAAGPASDQYALGVVIYECLTGQPPFKGDTVGEVFRAISAGNPTPPSTRQPEIPREIDAIVLRALGRDPKTRFGWVAALRRALLPFASKSAGATPTVDRPAATVERAAATLERPAATLDRMVATLERAAATMKPAAPKAEPAAATAKHPAPTMELAAATVERPAPAQDRPAPTSPAIAAEASTPSPFRRTLTPEVEALDAAWFAAGDAPENLAGAAAASAGAPASGELDELDISSSDAHGELESTAHAHRTRAARIWIGAGAGVMVAGLVLVILASRGRSSAAPHPLPEAALVQAEPAAASPPTDNVAPPATAPSEPPAPPSTAQNDTPAPARNEAPAVAAAPSEPPASTPAPPAEPPPVAAAPPTPPAAPPTHSEPPAPVANEARAVAAQNDAPVAPGTARARKPAADRPRARGRVRMHNGVPLLD